MEIELTSSNDSSSEDFGSRNQYNSCIVNKRSEYLGNLYSIEEIAEEVEQYDHCTSIKKSGELTMVPNSLNSSVYHHIDEAIKIEEANEVYKEELIDSNNILGVQ